MGKRVAGQSSVPHAAQPLPPKKAKPSDLNTSSAKASKVFDQRKHLLETAGIPPEYSKRPPPISQNVAKAARFKGS